MACDEGEGMVVRSRENLPNGDVIVEFEGYKELISSPTRKWSPSWWIYERGYYEKNVTEAVQRLLHPGDTAVDVGSNMGYYTVMIASMVGPTGRVIAFEPVREASRYLLGSAELNDFRHIELFDCCLGAENGTIAFDRASYRVNAAHRDSERQLMVPIRAFDDMASELAPERLALVKIDVEGAEFDVIQGMAGTIAEHRPHILIEIHPEMIREFGHTAQELLGRLEASGYRVTALEERGICVDGPKSCHVHAWYTGGAGEPPRDRAGRKPVSS